MSNKTYARTFWWKILLIGLLVVGLSVGITAGLSKATNGFEEDISTVLYNDDNLIREIEEYEGLVGNTGDGLVWTVNNNRSIKVAGKINNGAESVEWILGTVKVPEDGTYTLSGVKGATTSTIYICGTYTDTDGNEQTIIGDITNTCTAELVKGTIVTFKIVCYPDITFNKTINPTFVTGEEFGKF